MGTNTGSWKVGRGAFVGAVVLVVWLLTAVAERAIAGRVGLGEAIARLHPGQYALAAITACAVGLIGAWPTRARR